MGSGTQYGYVGLSLKNDLWGLRKIELTSFSSSLSNKVNLLFCLGCLSGNKYTLFLQPKILYLEFEILVVGAVAGVVVAVV